MTSLLISSKFWFRYNDILISIIISDLCLFVSHYFMQQWRNIYRYTLAQMLGLKGHKIFLNTGKIANRTKKATQS